MLRASGSSLRARQTRQQSNVSRGSVLARTLSPSEDAIHMVRQESPISHVPDSDRASSPGDMTAADTLNTRFCAQPRDSDQEEELQVTMRAVAAEQQSAEDHFWQRYSRQPNTESELAEYARDRHDIGLSAMLPYVTSSPPSSESRKSHRPSFGDMFSFVEEDVTRMTSPLHIDTPKHTNVAPGSNALSDLGEEDLAIVVSSGSIALQDLDEDAVTNVAPGRNALRDLGTHIFSSSNARLGESSRRRKMSPSQQDVATRPRPKRACVKPAYKELTTLGDSEDDDRVVYPSKGRSNVASKLMAVPKSKGKGKGKGKAVMTAASDDDAFEPEVIQDSESSADELYTLSPIGKKASRALDGPSKPAVLPQDSEDSDDVPLKDKFPRGKRAVSTPSSEDEAVECVRVEIAKVALKAVASRTGRVHPGLKNHPVTYGVHRKKSIDYEPYPAPGYFTKIRVPRGVLSAVNPGSLSLRAVFPRMLQTAYEMRKHAFPEEDAS
jgi:hypothetical protein